MKERRTKEKRKAWAHSIIASNLAFCHASKVFPGEVTTAAQTAAYVGGKCLVHRKRGSKLPHERHGRSALYHEHSKYVPHEIELAWLDKARDPEVDTCEHHRAHPEEAEANLKWMNAVQSLSNFKDDEELMDTPDESNLSKFVFYRSYKRGTNRTTVQWTEWIEPLVGITRHPFSLCHPLNVSIPKNLIASIFNIDYLLLQPDGKESVASRGRHGGKNFLFDLGTNYFRTGLGALLCKYSMAGVEFDEIYAWEAGAVNRQLYWDNVPKELHRRLHFYNVPVSADPMKPGNRSHWS